MKRNWKKRVCAMAVLGAVVLSEASVMGNSQAEAAESTEAAVKTGLKKENGKYYYYDSNGVMLKSAWKSVNGYRYYFTKSGCAATGLKKIGKKYYYFSSKGRLLTNRWVKVKGKKTYYIGADGYALTGYQAIKGKLYYFKSNGKKSDAKTGTIQSLAQYGKDFAPVRKLLGKPGKTEYYGYSCYGNGEDGAAIYKNKYVIYLFKDNVTGNVKCMGVEDYKTWKANQ